MQRALALQVRAHSQHRLDLLRISLGGVASSNVAVQAVLHAWGPRSCLEVCCVFVSGGVVHHVVKPE